MALVLATLFFAVQDAISKHAVQTVPVAQILVIRFFFFALFATVYAMRRTSFRLALRSQVPGLQLLRGVIIVTEIGLIAYAIGYIGIAEMHAVFACFPLIITILSIPLLGESVGWRRWLAVIAGFVGTLIILRPGSGVFTLYTGLVVLAAFLYALYMIITRRVSRHDSFATSLLYFGWVGLIATLLVSPFYWQPLNGNEILSILAISGTAIAGHLLVIKSLELVPAVILQPFNYCVLVWAMIVGFIVYGEVLDAPTLVGAAIVVASGTFIARREYLLSRRR